MTILFLIFESLSSIPTLAWIVGSLQLFFVVILGALNVIQFRQAQKVATAKDEAEAARNETAHWRGTAGAFKEELEVVRGRCDRLENENKLLVEKNAELSGKTDLTILQKQVMKFQTDNQEVHNKILQTLTELSVGNAERYLKATEILSSNTSAIKNLELHMTKAFGEITSVLAVIDSKLPAAA